MMTEMFCSVCKTPIDGLHYGVLCCRACTAFFRRTISMSLDYKCRFERRCDVTTKNRFSCRFCRYEKCVQIGLTKEIVLANSNGLTLPTSGLESEQESSSVASTSQDKDIKHVLKSISSPALHSIIGSIMQDRLSKIFQKAETIRNQELLIPLTLCQQGMLAYREHNARWPNNTFEKVKANSRNNNLDLDKFVRTYYAEYEYVALFCMYFSCFAELPVDQKWLIYRHFVARFPDLDRGYITCQILGYDLNDLRFVSFEGFIFSLRSKFTNIQAVSDISEEEMKEFLSKSNQGLEQMYIVPLKKMKPNEFEFVYICMTVLFDLRKDAIPELTDSTVAIAENMRTRLAEELHQYYVNELKQANYADRLHRISTIIAALDKLDLIRKEDSKLSRTFNIFNKDIFLSELFNE